VGQEGEELPLIIPAVERGKLPSLFASAWEGLVVSICALQVDAILCDGPSPENIASTVVDCTKIDSGNIGFFRVGIIPKSQVKLMVILFLLLFSNSIKWVSD